jgi:DNA-binding MarR family transcriptional regulator
MYHILHGGYSMKETKQSLSELWSLLRNKEEQFGLSNLSLTERDILQAIIYLQGKDDSIGLDDILKKCPHPRATFFRCLKKLRDNKFVKVTKDTEDARRSFIKVYPKFTN